jgi:ketosteroid isomerase-like protein
VQRLEGGSDLYVQRGRSRLVRQRDGARHVSEVEFVLVWQRQLDGRLRILVDAWW